MKKKTRGLIIIGIALIFLAAVIATYAREITGRLRKVMPWAENAAVFLGIADKKSPQAPEEKLASLDAQEEGAEEVKIVPVVVHRASTTDFEDSLPVMGTIKGAVEVEMRFEVNGVVSRINFREGDIVKKGDVIAMLIQKDAILKLEYSQSKLKTAKTQMLTAEKKYQIHQKLYKAGAIIKAKLEEMKLEYETAKSQAVSAEKEVEFAKQELEKTYLISPIGGIMGTRDVEEGEFVTSNTKIASIIDISSVLAEVGVIEKDLQKISLGQRAVITVDAFAGIEFEGGIKDILPVIEGKSRTITCKIKTDNSAGRLLPGMFARATIDVFSEEGALVVPVACLRDKNDDGIFDAAFVVDEENIARLAELEVGYLTADYAVIASGLEDGELVVTEARAELEDGSIVEILQTQEAFRPEEEGIQREEELILQ